MSYLTVEVEIDHGHVLPKGAETLPEKASGLLTFSRRCRWRNCVPAALPKASSPCRMTSTPRCLKTCCWRLKANENPAGHLRIPLARVRRREIIRRTAKYRDELGILPSNLRKVY